MVRLVYSKRYDIRAFGLERLHPFDAHKYGRAWNLLRARFGKQLNQHLVRPPRQSRRDELLMVHSAEYLDQLKDPDYVARALEVPQARMVLPRLLDFAVLRPMRWASMGSLIAAQEALQHGLAINMSGGYHHAKPAAGEGFCLYSDIGLAVRSLTQQGLLQSDSAIAYIDLDVHQGNGVCHVFLEDRRVFIFDMFNPRIYPAMDSIARERIDCPIPLPASCMDSEYMSLLESSLPPFLESAGRSTPIVLAIYNAGTDIYEGDALGGLRVSAAGVLQRDLYVLGELRQRGIPTLMLPSGGYSEESHRMITRTIESVLVSNSEEA